MFRRNVPVEMCAPDGTVSTETITPRARLFTPDGELRAIRAIVAPQRQATEITLDRIVRVADPELESEPVQAVLAEFDVIAEELETDDPVDPVRRRDFLRRRGDERLRTLGRHIEHVPAGAFRLVYTYGLNKRRVKDAFFVRTRPRRDDVLIRDVTNGARQAIPIRNLLTITDPRTERSVEDEEAIRAFLRHWRPKSLIGALRARGRVPQLP